MLATVKTSLLAAATLLLSIANAAPPAAIPARPTVVPPGPPGGGGCAPTPLPTAPPSCPPPVVPPQPDIGLPATCYAAGGGKPACFTYTTTAPAVTCPQILCPAPSPDQICPLYLKVSSTTVPCSTDCCPFTPTATYSCGPCPTCDPCRIPTELTIFTTGCPGGGVQSSVTIITPAF